MAERVRARLVMAVRPVLPVFPGDVVGPVEVLRHVVARLDRFVGSLGPAM